MKIKVLLISLLFGANIFAQSVEVLYDLTKSKSAYVNACINDNAVFEVDKYDVTVNDLKAGKKVVKKIALLDSKYHNPVLVNGIDLLMSTGQFEGDNCAFILQSISKSNEVIITKVVLDVNLNVVKETLLARYPYETTISAGQTNTKLLFDDVSKNYAYVEFTYRQTKESTYRVILFNQDMEITSNEVYIIDETQLKINFGGDPNIVNSAKFVDDKIFFESKGSIYSLYTKQFKTLVNKEITSRETYWEVATNGDGGIHIVINDKTTNIFRLFAFDQNLKLVADNKYVCPEELFASEKSVWGKGNSIKSIKKCAFDIWKFYVDPNGNTNLVMSCSVPYAYDIFNLTALKFDSKLDLSEKAIFPISHQTFMSSDVINEKGFISIICHDDGQWYDKDGNFGAENFPNKAAEKHALVLIQLSEEDFSKFTRTRIMLENQDKYKIDFNKSWLNCPDFQSASNTCYINVVENEQPGFISTAIYIGKLDLYAK